MTSERHNAITSPVRFMARGLAEVVGYEKAHADFPSCLWEKGRKASHLRRRVRRQRRRWPQGRSRLAPGAGGSARDHPVDQAGHDTRAGHDFEVAAYDA